MSSTELAQQLQQQQATMALAPVVPAAGELAATAAATQAMAAVQARYALALARPRNHDTVRAKLLTDCKRKSFAEVARYSKPVGGQSVEGPSIRFVEAALRAFTNVFREVTVSYDTAQTRLVRVSVTDLESNVTHQTDITVVKTVERRKVRPGQVALSQRQNSYGQTVYTVEATDDEVQTKQSALVSKAIRELGLRILPGDLVEEAQAECARTKMSEITQDPDAARKRIVDAFVAIGVQPVDLEKYLGYPLAQAAPPAISDLRKVYASVSSGETTWAEIMRSLTGDEDTDDDEGKKKGKKTDELKSKLKAGGSA